MAVVLFLCVRMSILEFIIMTIQYNPMHYAWQIFKLFTGGKMRVLLRRQEIVNDKRMRVLARKHEHI